MLHGLAPITAAQFRAYERATGQTEINARKKYWKSSEDHEEIAAVYDALAESLGGALFRGESCTPENKSAWVPLVPFFHKVAVAEEAIRRHAVKNVL